MASNKQKRDLMPFFEHIWLNAIALCDKCGDQIEFSSAHEDCSDDWWFDGAKAMQDAGWVVPDTESAFCAVCAESLGIKHNPKAYTLTMDSRNRFALLATYLCGVSAPAVLLEQSKLFPSPSIDAIQPQAAFALLFLGPIVSVIVVGLAGLSIPRTIGSAALIPIIVLILISVHLINGS